MKKQTWIQEVVEVKKGVLAGVTVGIVALLVFQVLERVTLQEARDQVVFLSQAVESQESEIVFAQETIDDLKMEIEEYEEEGDDLKKDLRKAEKRYEDIEESVGEALGTVEVLNKKSKVDPQLLQKYSKVYFLNEHYVPESVDSVPDEYTFGKEVLIHGKISSFAEDMFEDAEDDGIDLRTVSGFRSFGTQAALKSRYLVSYGSGANQFSADQGYSEHQLGTTLDFSTELLGDSFEAFGGTEAFEWMEDNAYKYGFTLSYPEGNAFYQYEPWHWRFVGKDLAKYLDRNNDYFYDVDQRKIDEYTADFFDR